MTALTDNLRFLATKHDGDPLVSRVPSSSLIEAADEIERLRVVLPFFRSVILSGESWTDVCEQRYREAMGQ